MFCSKQPEHPGYQEATTGEPNYSKMDQQATAKQQTSYPPPFPEAPQPPLSHQDGPLRRPSHILTKSAGSGLVDEQADRDVPARGPVHSGVAGLLASHRAPAEASIFLSNCCYSQVPCTTVTVAILTSRVHMSREYH